MKKLVTLIIVVTIAFAFVTTPSAQAASSFSGSTYMSAPGFSSVTITTSSNVYMLYIGNAGLSYGAYTKNRAGDKYYATGGGGTASSGIYYSTGAIQDISFGSCSSSMFVTGAGWTAQ